MFDVSYQKVVWEDGKVRIPPFMEGGRGGGVEFLNFFQKGKGLTNFPIKTEGLVK